MRAAKMNMARGGLALLLLACGGCSSFRFEPTANWWREGGRLCAANRDPLVYDWERAAPRSCAQALADTPGQAKRAS